MYSYNLNSLKKTSVDEKNDALHFKERDLCELMSDNNFISTTIDNLNFFNILKYVFLLKDPEGHIIYISDYAAQIYGITVNKNSSPKELGHIFKRQHPVLYRQFAKLDKHLHSSANDMTQAITFANYSDKVPARLTTRHRLVSGNKTIAILHQEVPFNPYNYYTSILNEKDNDISARQILDMEHTEQATQIIRKLSSYEQEICFLLSIGWTLPQIFALMTRLGHDSTFDALVKKKNVICIKIGMNQTQVENLQNELIRLQFYKHLPPKLIKQLHGSYLLPSLD